MQRPFKVNYVVVCSFLVSILLGGLLWLWLFSTPVTKLFRGETLSQETMKALIFLTILLLGTLSFSVGVLISETSVVFSDEFVRKGKLRHAMLMWRDVTSVSRFGYRVILRSVNRKMEINLIYYSDPDKIMHFIQDHTQTRG